MGKFFFTSVLFVALTGLAACNFYYEEIRPGFRVVKQDGAGGIKGYQTFVNGHWYAADEEGALTAEGLMNKRENESGGGDGGGGGGGGC